MTPEVKQKLISNINISSLWPQCCKQKPPSYDLKQWRKQPTNLSVSDTLDETQV